MSNKILKFDPGALSIIQMGQELIGHPSTALGELVKNAYDADALDCKVYIHSEQNLNNSFLIIYDNGTGMNDAILFGEWLQPSVSSKRGGLKKSNVFKRSLLGSKGIGRLAAMALGKHLTVISKQSDEDQYNWLYLDRDSFNVAKLLSEITFPGGRIKNYKKLLESSSIRNENLLSNGFLLSILEKLIQDEFKEGTLIILEVIDESVKTIIEEDYVDAERELTDSKLLGDLRSLLTPLGLIEQSQIDLLGKKIIDNKYFVKQTEDFFKVEYGASIYDHSFEGVDKLHLEPVKPGKILEKYNYRIFGKANQNGEVLAHYFCRRLPENKYDKKIELSQEDTLSNDIGRRRIIKVSEELPTAVSNASMGEFFFDIRIFDRDPDEMESLSKQLKLDGKSAARKFLDQIIGLRIAKNGFGVKPYGEEEKDWMELGQLRVQDPTFVIGPNQVFGFVFLISPQNDGLSEKTNREGFFENKAFIDLKKIIKAIILVASRERYAFRLKHNLGRNFKNILKRPDVKSFMNYLSRTIEDEKLISKANKFVTDVNTTLDNMESTLSFSQRLATLGSGLELVYHELTQPISKLGGVLTSLEINKDKINPDFKKGFQNNLNTFDSSLNVLDELKDSISPSIGISKPKLFLPYETFQKVCRLFNKDIKEFSISILSDDKIKNYQVKDFEYAIWVAFLNIINNAIYWLKKSDNKKSIFLSLEKENKIVITNNGPEIEEDYISEIFEYGVTFKTEKNATGLGLAFTRSILHKHDWNIFAENREMGPAFIINKVEGKI